MEWVAELAERTIESPHDRARFESRLARVREALEKQHSEADAMTANMTK